MPEQRGRPTPPGSRTVIAIDFGRTRIGVAVGQDGLGTAGPLPALRGDAPGPDWRAVAALLETWKPQLLLVGRPATLDGRATWMTERAAGFAHELERRFGLAVELVDERLTSRAARSELAQQRSDGVRRRRVRPADVDSVAAQLILRGWIEENAAARRRPRLA